MYYLQYFLFRISDQRSILICVIVKLNPRRPGQTLEWGNKFLRGDFFSRVILHACACMNSIVTPIVCFILISLISPTQQVVWGLIRVTFSISRLVILEISSTTFKDNSSEKKSYFNNGEVTVYSTH